LAARVRDGAGKLLSTGNIPQQSGTWTYQAAKRREIKE
jgi:hypothetical protein